MKRHGRPIFGITKRTRFAAAMVVVAVVLVMAVIVLGYVGIFGLRSELFEIAVTTDEAGDMFGGTVMLFRILILSETHRLKARSIIRAC